jgi:rubrerythrin
VSNYWYVVNDSRREYVFCVGQQERPDDDHVDLFLRDNAIHWTGAFRLVGDYDDEMDVIEAQRYRQIEGVRPMLVRERYGFWSCPECGRTDSRAGATWGCAICQKRVGVR